MISKCPKCMNMFDSSRWDDFNPQMPIGGGGMGRDCRVCDDCLDDNIRHKIIENYLGYKKVGFKKEVIVTRQRFDELLCYMSFNNVDEFHQWYERENSKHDLLSFSVYHDIGTASPYPVLIKAILEFVGKS